MEKPVTRAGAWVFIGSLLLASFVALTSLRDLTERWLTDEAYGHGFIVVLISGYFFLSRLPSLPTTPRVGRAWGFGSFALILLLLVISEAAQIHTLSQYLLIALIASLAVTTWGVHSLRVIAPSLILLVFAIPLPNFIQTMLTADLQLLSSSLGVQLLKFASVPVFLQGNVIDLGTYQLQVIEACAGLNYLFPLLGIAFICACYLRTPYWQRILIVLSAVPITVLLNSARIAATGLLLKRFGTEAADGFIHFFEGWLVFIACLAVLLLEMWFLATFVNRNKLTDDLDLNVQMPATGTRQLLQTNSTWQLYACAALCGIALIATQALTVRQEHIPARPAFALFPMQLGAWSGASGQLPPENISTLALSDYLLARYVSSETPESVELYMAYYDSQKDSGGMHSPKVCLPGGGWEITQFGTLTQQLANLSVRLNRATLQRGLETRLVYYWFQQGGHTFANELVVKADIFRRSLIDNSTSGALIRVSTAINAQEGIEPADARLVRFLERALPNVSSYIPQ